MLFFRRKKETSKIVADTTFKVFGQGKNVTICLVTCGRGGIMKKVASDGIGGGGFKIWHFRGDVILE